MSNIEKIRENYNRNYSQKRDRWSIHDLKNANKIIGYILKKTSINTQNSIPYALDVGCAKGHITEALRLHGFKAYGIDYSDVAISIAKQNFPSCTFYHMDGFNPNFKEKFDLILVRGFSGTNTHNIDFIADFSKKYINLLKKDGIYIIGFRTNFSGIEKGKEMANLTFNEINKLNQKLNYKLINLYYFPSSKIIELKNLILYPFNLMKITNKKYKYFVYLIFSN